MVAVGLNTRGITTPTILSHPNDRVVTAISRWLFGRTFVASSGVDLLDV
jgi:hypothetical protein